MTVLEATSSPEALAAIERRRKYIEPLYAYLSAHHYSRPRVFEAARLAAVAADEYVPWDVRAWYNRAVRMQRGEARIPLWLVIGCCATIEKSVAEVMGAAWVERYGEEGRGGAEDSPASEPRHQRRGWRGRVRSSGAIAVPVSSEREDTADDAA
jgi:hypothetical protein